MMIAKIHAMRKRVPVAALLLSGLLVLAQPLWAQTGEDALRFSQRFPASGARMIGLAGAGLTAGAGDYGALFTNPAGLGLYQQSELTGGLNAFATNDASTYLVPDARGNLQDSDIRNTRLGNLAYIHKVPTMRGSLVLGAAYNQVMAFDRSLLFGGPNAANSITDSFLPYADEVEVVQDDEGNYRPQFFNVIPEMAYMAGAIEFLGENVETGGPLFYQAVMPGTTIEQQGSILEEGQMSELNLGGAVEAARDVMVGLSANLTFGTYAFESTFEEIDTQDENGEEDYVVLLGNDELRGFHALRHGTGFESDLTGFNLRAGLSAQVTKSIRLGGSLETPTFYAVREDYYRNLETVFDVGGSLQDSQEGTFEYEITTPWRLGGGITYSLADLNVSADVEYVDWSQMKLDAAEEDFSDINRNIRQNLDPVLNTRVGAEYRLGDLMLRAGLALNPDPRAPEASSRDKVTDRSKTFYAVGASYHFSRRLAVDLGWLQEHFDDFYQPYGNVETTPPAVEERVVRDYLSVGLRLNI